MNCIVSMQIVLWCGLLFFVLWVVFVVALIHLLSAKYRKLDTVPHFVVVGVEYVCVVAENVPGGSSDQMHWRITYIYIYIYISTFIKGELWRRLRRFCVTWV